LAPFSLPTGPSMTIHNARSVESYKHRFAKETLAGWLRGLAEHDEYACLEPINWRVNRGPPHYGVWTEYPVCLDAENDGLSTVWDELDWNGEWPWPRFEQAPPTYAECLENGWVPSVIFDVAVQHKGWICYAFEVVHRHGVTPEKLARLKRMAASACGTPRVYTIPADWILCQVGVPDRLLVDRVV
jgi:hypothetical protein